MTMTDTQKCNPKVQYNSAIQNIVVDVVILTWYCTIVHKTSMSVPWMSPECSLNVHWMLPGCELIVHWIFPECSLTILGVFTECSQNVPCSLRGEHTHNTVTHTQQYYILSLSWHTHNNITLYHHRTSFISFVLVTYFMAHRSPYSVYRFCYYRTLGFAANIFPSARSTR